VNGNRVHMSGSGFMDLCECLCRQFQRHLESVEGILHRVNGQAVVNHNGGGGLSPLARPNGGGGDVLNPVTLVTITFMVMMFVMLFAMRPRARPAAPATDKPHPSPPPAPDRNLLD